MFVTVKAFVCEAEGSPSPAANIHKFVIDRQHCSSFEYLCAKLVQIVPELKVHKFRITWQDRDGDHITMSNSEELMVALMESEAGANSCLKIRVTKSPEKKKGASEGGVHRGVLCDSCDGVVRGNRYKCAVCPDYDLCSQCEMAGRHTQHRMVRIPYQASAVGHLQKQRNNPTELFLPHLLRSTARPEKMPVYFDACMPELFMVLDSDNQPAKALHKKAAKQGQKVRFGKEDQKKKMEKKKDEPKKKANNEKEVSTMADILTLLLDYNKQAVLAQAEKEQKEPKKGPEVKPKEAESEKETKDEKKDDNTAPSMEDGEAYMKFMNDAFSEVIPQIMAMKAFLTDQEQSPEKEKQETDTAQPADETEKQPANETPEDEASTENKAEKDDKLTEDETEDENNPPTNDDNLEDDVFELVKDHVPTPPIAEETPTQPEGDNTLVSSPPEQWVLVDNKDLSKPPAEIPITTLAALAAMANTDVISATTTTAPSFSSQDATKTTASTSTAANIPVVNPQNEILSATSAVSQSLPASPVTTTSTVGTPQQQQAFNRSMPIAIPIAMSPVVTDPACKKPEDYEKQENMTSTAGKLTSLEQRIEEARQQLMAKGYSDEGGWLTKLIQAKQGNVIEVLKALAPFSQ